MHFNLDYRDKDCEGCIKIRHQKLYMQLYKKIVSGKLSPTQLLNVQEKIYHAVLSVRRYDGSCNYYDKLKEEYKFRTLVIIALQIYAIGPDPYELRSLTTSDSRNDLFNDKEIAGLLRVAKSIVRKKSKCHIIVSDLCIGNLQLGDLIVSEGNKVVSYEVKTGEKNIEIVNKVRSCKENPYTSPIDREHFNRVKKQRDRRQLIINRFQTGYFTEHSNDGTHFYIPYWIEGIDEYSETFKKALKEARHNIYKKTTVDDQISIITINRAAYLEEQGLVSPQCISNINRGAELLCKYDSIQASHLEQFDSKHKNEIDNTVFYYNDVLRNTDAPQPYLWGIDGKTVSALYEDTLQVFTEIKIDYLFNYLRENGFKVYERRRINEKNAFVKDNKNWVVENTSISTYCPLIVTEDYIRRIRYGMYTSEGIALFLKKLSEFIEQFAN